MTISFNIPDAVYPRVLEALQNHRPEVKAMTAEQIIKYWVKNVVTQYEMDKAMSVARSTVTEVAL